MFALRGGLFHFAFDYGLPMGEGLVPMHSARTTSTIYMLHRHPYSKTNYFAIISQNIGIRTLAVQALWGRTV